MASPYVCSTCRSKLLRPSLQAARSITRTATRSQQNYARDDPDALLQIPRGRGANTRSASNGNGSTRGRYSGKELRPEQLLYQLDQPLENRGTTTARQEHETRPRPRSNATRSTNAVRETSRPGQPSPAAHALANRFIAQVNEEDFNGAWQSLQQLGSKCDGIVASGARTLFTKRDMVPSLHKLLWKATRQWVDGWAGKKHESELPSPADVHSILFRLRATNASLYRPTLWHLASGIADLHFAQKFDSQGTLQTAVGHLMRIWRICMAIQSTYAQGAVAHFDSVSKPLPSDDYADWSFLPPAATFASSQSERRSRTAFEGALHMLVPMPAPQADHNLRTDYASPALITLDLLRNVKLQEARGQSISLARLPEHAPFVQLLEAILSNVPAPRIPKDLFFKLEHKANDATLRQHYETMVVRLGLDDDRQKIASSEPPNDVGNETQSSPFVGENDGTNVGEDLDPSNRDLQFAEKPHTPQIEAFALLNVKRLGRALEQRDMYQTEKIRREVYAFAGSHLDDPKAVPLEMYEHLMLVFLSLRNPNAAIEIWNEIMRRGYKPTVKTYSVMMRGARTSKDRPGMEAFWSKMRQAGCQPDEHAWSIRISGLFGLNAEKQGMNALTEMSREWFIAARSQASRNMAPSQIEQFAARSDLATELLSKYPGPVEGVPRPNVVILNSAVSALANRRDHMIADVLRWGRSFGIEADLTTYNALLNVSMRKGEATEAMNILQSMQNRGIQADSTTWTVILTALFHGGFLDGLDHLEQQKRILTFVEQLENKGTGMPGLDEKGFALIIDRLLKLYSNPTAANAIMARMVETGRKPTCHIYTILMSHYFELQPEPDLAAVQALWRHIESDNNGWGAPLDNVFYDRMIEGYARHHRLAGIKSALNFRKRAQQAGQKTGWVALETLARALAERQMRDQLQILVNEVKRDMRENRGRAAYHGQRNFFSFIAETGLLEAHELADVRQAMEAYPKEGPLMRAAARAAEDAWSRPHPE